LIDDWTGDRWARNVLTYGREPYPPNAPKWKQNKLSQYIQIDEMIDPFDK